MVDTKRSLYRLPKKGKIFGVCAGLADYFDMDVTLMRVIFVVLAFATGGAMVVLYIILAIVLPVPGESKSTINDKVERLGEDIKDSKAVFQARNYMGVGLIILGVWLLLSQFLPQMFDFRWEFVWPILLILVGLLIIVRRGYGR